MAGDRLYVNTPDIAAEIGVADLPDDIMALFRSFQGYFSDAEKQKAEALTTIHQANFATINSRIRWIDDQIARFNSHRRNLLSKRDQESKNVAILKSILNPIRRVPTDVLCEIFLHCLPDSSTMAPTNILSANEAPLLLCRVCTKWRRTALAFPSLWKALTLRAGYKFYDEQQCILTIHPSISPILNSWFSRAGSCPLSLGFDLHEADEVSDLTLELKDVLNGLPNSRLQHLSLNTFYPSDTYFLSNIPQEFMELKAIYLRTDFGPRSESVPAPDRLLQSAPRLHSAELHKFIRPNAVPRFLIPWPQLTHLRIEDQLGETMWYILICLCTNLQHGIFSIDCNSADVPPVPFSNHEIILPHLIDLTVHTTKNGSKPDFRQLVFPTLRRLQLLLEGSFHLLESELPANNSNSLNSLIIIGIHDFTQPELQSLLNSSSSITELRLSINTIYTEFFKVLIPSSHSPPLLPKLKVLHCDIRDKEDTGAILKSIVLFVQSRWWDELNSPSTPDIARLQRLTLRFHAAVYEGHFIDQARHSLAPFGGQGLSLVLGTWDDHSLNLREMMRFELE